MITNYKEDITIELQYKYSIIILNHYNKKNIIEYILPLLLKLPYIDEILLSNVDPETSVGMDDPNIICFDHTELYNTHGLETRYIVAEQSSNDHIIFLHDDIICFELSKMLYEYENNTEYILGIFGEILEDDFKNSKDINIDNISNDLSDYVDNFNTTLLSDTIITDSDFNNTFDCLITEPMIDIQECDIILSKCMVFHKEKLDKYFKYNYLIYSLEIDEPIKGIASDLLFSILYSELSKKCVDISYHNLETQDLPHFEYDSTTISNISTICQHNANTLIYSIDFNDGRFSKHTQPLLKSYATICESDMYTILPTEYRIKYGTTEKEFIFHTMLDFLKHYDRVMYISDSSCINLKCNNIFNRIPRDKIGVVGTDNWNILCMSKQHIDVNQNIWKDDVCKDNLYILDSKYNFTQFTTSSGNVKKNISSAFLKKCNAWIYNVTKFYQPHREKFIQQICDILQ